MKISIRRTLLPIAALIVSTPHAGAADIEEMASLTREMVARAADHYTAVGRAQAEVDFNEKSEAWYSDLYYLHMFGMDADGKVWADNVWPEFIGTDFSEAADFNGVLFGRDILENTPRDGTIYRVDLQFMNPDTGDLSPSVGACLRPDTGAILCSWTNG